MKIESEENKMFENLPRILTLANALKSTIEAAHYTGRYCRVLLGDGTMALVRDPKFKIAQKKMNERRLLSMAKAQEAVA